MPGNKSIKADYNAEYDKSDLLRPHKLVVSFGERSTLLYDNEENNETYDRLFKEAKRVIRTAILTNSKEAVRKISVEELGDIRNTRGVSFIFNMPLEIEAIYKLMNISSSSDLDMGSIDEIIVSRSLNKVYFYSVSQDVLYEFAAEGIQNNLDFMIANLEKQHTVSALYLNRFQPGFYSKNVVVPTRAEERGLPVLLGEKEIEAQNGIPERIAKLFDDEISSLSIIKNMDGTLVYTDREDQVVKLYTNGMLEYVNYDMPPAGSNAIDVRSAIDISIDFVRGHFEFPDNCYISDVVRTLQGDKYIVRYKYAYEGLPVIPASGFGGDTIEVEIVGDKVKRYKRMVRELSGELEYKQVMNFREVLDILLDKKVEELSGEKITHINDMYLAYYEKYGTSSITYIPVWVAEVTAEKFDNGTVSNQRYIINAETGIILDK